MSGSTLLTRRVVLDIDLCIDCRSCAAACSFHHNHMPIVAFGTTPAATLPVICRQCDAPGCVDACPNGAMSRDEHGIVTRALFRCTGCMSCVMGCPFGVITEALEGEHIPKCDLCEHRVLAGQEPWCVASCSSGALKFMDPDMAEEAGLVLLGGRTAGSRPWGRR